MMIVQSNHNALHFLGKKRIPSPQVQIPVVTPVEINQNIDVRDTRGRTALMRSLAQGIPEAVHELLQQGASPNVKDQDGWTPLMTAATKGKKELILPIIQTGADLNERNKDGQTALMLAAKMGQWEAVETLLSAKAKASLQDHQGKTALHYASESGRWELAILRAYRCLPSVPGERRKIIAALVKAKASVNTRDLQGQTALMVAGASGEEEAIKALLKHGAYIDNQDDQGRTALFYAIQKCRKKAVEILINTGASVNIQDFNKWTPMMMARAEGFPEIEEMLRAKGAESISLTQQMTIKASQMTHLSGELGNLMSLMTSEED